MKPNIVKLHSKTPQQDRHCGTCRYRERGECSINRNYLSLRPFDFCDDNFSAWQRNLGVLERLKVWFFGDK